MDSACTKAAEMVESQKVTMAKAVEKVLPESRRLAILSAHESLRPAMRHRTIERVETMQGVSLQERGKRLEAYRFFERAAEIEYAITGDSYFYAKALWRLVGSAITCGMSEVALEHLHRIKHLQCFEEFPKDSAAGRSAFMDLTLAHASGYMRDPRKNKALKSLVEQTIH